MDIIRRKYSPWKILQHKWQARRDIPFRRKFFVGYDLYGNTYWEFTEDKNMSRLRRKMQPLRQELFEVDYFKTVPPQWLQWLRRTRDKVPTLEELIQDQMRQERMKMLAASADEKWKLEKMRLEQIEKMKLQTELDRVKQEQIPANEKQNNLDQTELESLQAPKLLHADHAPEFDPWKQADESRDKDPIQSASLSPQNPAAATEVHRESEIENPWKQADESRDKDPIEVASIKPRQ